MVGKMSMGLDPEILLTFPNGAREPGSFIIYIIFSSLFFFFSHHTFYSFYIFFLSSLFLFFLLPLNSRLH
jgi:hypothetical protein